MILYEKTLLGFAQTILRITGREEHSKTMDNILKVYYRPAKDEIFLARWSKEENAILIKTYDRSVNDWSDGEVEYDLVSSLRDAGVEVEVNWDE